MRKFNMNNEYITRLEETIKQMLKPIKNIPFNLIIESISNQKVIEYDDNNSFHNIHLNKITDAVCAASKKINRHGIWSTRANEVGNAIEPFLLASLNELDGFNASTPTTASGKHKSTGYPDIELQHIYNNRTQWSYIECKTYNRNNIDTTQRSFYLSPSSDFKVTRQGIHFIVSFEIVEIERNNEQKKNMYKTCAWKILDASRLYCDVKYEFNSDNKRLYNKNLVLAEGTSDIN